MTFDLQPATVVVLVCLTLIVATVGVVQAMHRRIQSEDAKTVVAIVGAIVCVPLVSLVFIVGAHATCIAVHEMYDRAGYKIVEDRHTWPGVKVAPAEDDE